MLVKKGNEDEVLEFVKKYILVSVVDECSAFIVSTVFNKIAIKYGNYLAYVGNRFMVIRKNDAENIMRLYNEYC